MSMEMRTQKQMLVFEAVNDTLKESFVGATSLPLSIIERRHHENPPEAMAHWEDSHIVHYRCVESGLSARETTIFLKSYANTSEKFGWKTSFDALQ
jgi:hypothetical protein